MERRMFKFIVIAFIFFMGISLGNISTKNDRVQIDIDEFETTNENGEIVVDIKPEEEYIGIDKVENNFFTIVAKDGEMMLEKTFEGFFDVTGGIIKFIFGI